MENKATFQYFLFLKAIVMMKMRYAFTRYG